MGMTVYNLILNGAISTITIGEALLEFAIGFLIAFLLDLFLVGPTAKKTALKLPFPKSNKGYTILAISTCMVLGMAMCMSVYGLAIAHLTGGYDGGSLMRSYFLTFGKNFIMAYPLQLIVIGPLVRFLFPKLRTLLIN